MVSGTLAASGYWNGDRTWEGRDANPKGFHEDREVNAINEALLTPLTRRTLPGRAGQFVPNRHGLMQRWLAPIDDRASVELTPRLRARIEKVLSHRPFALKDPRFGVTLPAWRPLLPTDTAFLVVFREPGRSVTSIVKEVDDARYLRNIRLDARAAEALWCQTYRRILAEVSLGGDWLFVHYDEIVEGRGLERMGAFLDAALDRGFADVRLRRSAPAAELSQETEDLYAELLSRSGRVDA
jgi:hypothetical protein